MLTEGFFFPVPVPGLHAAAGKLPQTSWTFHTVPWKRSSNNRPPISFLFCDQGSTQSCKPPPPLPCCLPLACEGAESCEKELPVPATTNLFTEELSSVRPASRFAAGRSEQTRRSDVPPPHPPPARPCSTFFFFFFLTRHLAKRKQGTRHEGVTCRRVEGG